MKAKVVRGLFSLVFVSFVKFLYTVVIATIY